MGTELIMGMEEVINYLKELEEKNKKLQEDLKTQTTRADAWEKSYYSECEVRQSDMYRVKEENKKLQEKYDNMCEVRYSVSEMRQEQVRRLTEEIKKLTEEINQYKNESCESLVKEQKLYGQLFQFQEENKKLKEKQEYFRVRNCDRMEELVKALSPWKKNHSDHKRILEAIGELKEENKELKEQLAIKEAEQEEEANLICSLKEENKKLQQYYDKWSIILSEIDGDDFCDLLKDCGWEENDEGELVRSEEPAGAEELTEPESDKP